MNREYAAAQTLMFLQRVVEELVTVPGRVRVCMADVDGCVVFDVLVAPGDVGRVIGKGGQVARSIRTLLDSVAAKTGLKYELNLPHGGSEGSRA